MREMIKKHWKAFLLGVIIGYLLNWGIFLETIKIGLMAAMWCT